MTQELKREYYHLQGYELTRKIILEGAPEEVPDMFRELGDILDEIAFEDGDRVSGVQVQQMMGKDKVKILATLISQPKKD